MGNDKSLDPDDFPVEFYKKYWDIVGPQVTKAIKTFFYNGKILKQIYSFNSQKRKSFISQPL